MSAGLACGEIALSAGCGSIAPITQVQPEQVIFKPNGVDVERNHTLTLSLGYSR
jgi:hypothetical protein